MKHNAISWSGIVALAISYIMVVIGVLSIFSISFYGSVALIAAGTVMGLLIDRTKIPMTRSSWIISLAGCAMMFCILALVGEDGLRQWRPLPGLYIPAWIVLFHGSRHVRYLVLHHQRHEDVAA